MIWSYGVTTVPERRGVLLPRTLASLKNAGFDSPHLFVDNCDDPEKYGKFGLSCTFRIQNVKTFANWMLALWELFVKNPDADRFAIFQDDFVAAPALREYLDSCEWQDKSYLNLLTFRENHDLLVDKPTGWHKSDQLGKGAVALVYDKRAVLALLSSSHMLNWPKDRKRGTKLVDRAASQALKLAGFTEYIHKPSLIQHTGLQSSMGSTRHPQSTCFRGENFQATRFMLSAGPAYSMELPENKPTIRVALPAVNAENMTKDCLRHLAATDWPMLVDYVDNGSKLGVCERITKFGQSLGLHMESVRWDTNQGFTPAVNVSMEKARDLGQYCLILNNDCMVASNTIPRLFLGLTSDAKAAAVGPFSSDLGNQSLRDITLLSYSGIGKFPTDHDCPDAVSKRLHKVELLSRKMLAFFCTLISPEALNTVGILPSDFTDGLGADDAWCHFARKAGMTCNIVANAYAYHIHSETFRQLGINRNKASAAAVEKLRKL